VGEWFREAGVDGITVSSTAMAEAFAGLGWTDITVAFPVNPRELDAVDALAGKIDLGVLVDSEAAVAALEASLSNPVRAWMKIDVGYGRVGIPWSRPERVVALARRILRAPPLRFEGLLTHAGHAYRERSTAGLQRIHEDSVARLFGLKQVLADAGVPPVKISIGDTPTCSTASDFGGIDEIRPGNFVFYDVTQRAIGSCTDDAIALAVACPVTGLYPERNRIALHGGAVHLAREALRGPDGRPLFGYLARPGESGLGSVEEGAAVVDISQEHGMVELPASLSEGLAVGDLVLVFPVHSCLAANLHRGYVTLEGKRIERIRGL
jgi:D-serine deaminase-like pyridoxal phosphate-dependent protein